MEIINYRSGLNNLQKAINEKDEIKIGYIGGSITQEVVKYNWPEKVTMWFKNKYPDKFVCAENMGIGGTGSNIAVFRYDWEMADKNCDLIFIEFAVNDTEDTKDNRACSREGLVRKILKTSNADIVFVYTYCQDFYNDMKAGKVPDSIAEFEAIAEHYNIPSVWMARKAFDMISGGLISFEELLADGLHPSPVGSRIYASSVIEYLETAVNTNGPELSRTTTPLRDDNWENSSVISFKDIKTNGTWYLKSLYNFDFRHALYTSSITAGATINVHCKKVVICRLYGTDCCALKYRVNGGEWQIAEKPVVGWMGGANWPYHTLLASSDTETDFTIELEGEKLTREMGSSTYIAYIGIIK